jgi:hypothetical protein
MRYFRPRFKIATLVGAQDRLISKVGGIPWGLPAVLWPHCCGSPQKLLGQFCHEPPMLDLGAPGVVLHLFQCLECCGIDYGGRSAFLVDRSRLTDSLSEVPGYDTQPGLGKPLIGELWIDGWVETDDGIPAARLPEFYVEKDLWTLQDEFASIDWFGSRESTKFGGTPRWTGNGPMGFPPPPFEFLFQLDNYLTLEGPPPTASEAGCIVSENRVDAAGRSAWTHSRPEPGELPLNAPWEILYEPPANEFSVEFTNLGSDGKAYVFIDRTQRPHEVRWFWNR